MLKKIGLNILLMAVIIVASQATGAKADDSLCDHHPVTPVNPCTQAELNASTCVTLGGYAIRAASDSKGTFTYTVDPAFNKPPCDDFKYDVDLAIPACGVKNTISLISSAPTMSISNPGQGSILTGFATGVYQDKVVSFRVRPDIVVNNFTLTTDSAVSGETSISVNFHAEDYHYERPFTGKIIGPACPLLSGFSIANPIEYKTVDNFDLKITRDSSSGCISEMRVKDPSCSDGWCLITADTTNLTGGDSQQHTLLSCGALNANQKCQECTAIFHSPTPCVVMSSGGVTYKLPRGCF